VACTDRAANLVPPEPGFGYHVFPSSSPDAAVDVVSHTCRLQSVHIHTSYAPICVTPRSYVDFTVPYLLKGFWTEIIAIRKKLGEADFEEAIKSSSPEHSS
jgi:hypothetical protein